MTSLFGYLHAWSVAPGDVVEAYLACAQPVDARMDLVQLGLGEERADADGVSFQVVAAVASQHVPLGWQETNAGSCAVVAGFDRVGGLPLSGTLVLGFQPWEMTAGDAALVHGRRDDGDFVIGLDSCWCPFVQIGPERQRLSVALVTRRWYWLVFTWDVLAGQSELRVLSSLGKPLGELKPAMSPGVPMFDALAPLAFAARACAPGRTDSHFNGRLESPLILHGPTDIAALLPWLCGSTDAVPGRLYAHWDFSRQIGTRTIEDTGPHDLHGDLCNLPKRAVRGIRWTGACLDWRQCPRDYAAIHFHDDDLIDAGWEVSGRMALPLDLGSGAYAIRVCAGSEQLLLPLFVRALEPGRKARIGLVFPTYTYLAYSNDHTLLHGNGAEVLAARAVSLEPADVAMAAHPEWGLSLYDTHTDGSGVTLSSRWRPIPTLAPDQRAWQAGEGSGRWNYPADLLLVAWLNREGIPWEALTDEDIDRGGVRTLACYDLLLTGNHPEYATPNMVAAYKQYLEGGGRLMYMGGNGFYWKVASTPDRAGLIELRRAEDGNRSWAEEPGEYVHQLDAGYGGLWRRSGVAPQSWLGVGYSGQGFRRSVGYLRAPDSGCEEVAFVFEGVTAAVLGRTGVIGGACAGIEVDRVDELLGSPREGYLLASSEPFDETYFITNEEILVTRPTISGSNAPTVRADLFLQTHDGGGAVFSTGSIAWVGGLAAEGGDQAVQRICRNVINRFLDKRPMAPRPPKPVHGA